MKTCVFCKTRYKTGSGITFHKFPTDSTKQLWMKNMKIDNWSPRANDILCSKHFTDDCFIKHAARTTLKSGSIPTSFSESTHLARRDTVVIPTPCQLIKVKRKTLTPDELMEFKKRETPKPNELIEVKKETHTPFEFIDVKRKTPTPCVSIAAKRKLSSIYADQNNPNLDKPSTSGTQNKFRTVHEVLASIKHDHIYENTSKSSRAALQRANKALQISRTRVKVLSQHVKRLKNSVSILKSVIANLRKHKLNGDDCANMFKRSSFMTKKKKTYM